MSSGVKLNLISQNLEILPTIPINCTELYCNNNKIKELPENLPKYINTLNCSNNQITKLPEKLPDFLKTLYINNNQITELPDYSNHYRLENIYCEGNKIKKIKVETLIKVIDISFNTELEELYISPRSGDLHLTLDINQFNKFYKDISPIEKKIFLEINVPTGTKKFYKKLTEFSGKQTLEINVPNSTNKKSTKDFRGTRIIENYNITNFSNNIKKNIIEKYNLGNSYKITSRIEGGGNKRVKKNKNPKKINMKKSELQKIALKNKVSLKKRDGTIKKKDELIKSLKLKKLL